MTDLIISTASLLVPRGKHTKALTSKAMKYKLFSKPFGSCTLMNIAYLGGKEPEFVWEVEL